VQQKKTPFDFTRARSEDTLLIMVKGACRRNGWLYDETLDSYRIAAQSYQRLGNRRAAEMFNAAYRRQQELGSPVLRSDKGEGSLEENIRRAINEFRKL
jgi:hypothetical protein